MTHKLVERAPCDSSAPLRIGVLASSSGTQLQGLIDACNHKGVDAAIEAVISNRKEAPALDRARAAGLTTRVIPSDAFDSDAAYDVALLDALATRDVELVCMLGFTQPLSEGFFQELWPRVLRLHASLLPAFTGPDPIASALQAGVRITGSTLSLVHANSEQSRIVLQSALRIWPSDDEESLTVRIRVLEQRMLASALHLIAQGRIHVDDKGLGIEGDLDQDAALEWLPADSDQL